MSCCRSSADKRDAAKAVAEDQASQSHVTLNHVFSSLLVGKRRKNKKENLTKAPFSHPAFTFLAFPGLSVTHKPSENVWPCSQLRLSSARHSRVEMLPQPCLNCPTGETPKLNLEPCDSRARFSSCWASLAVSWAWKSLVLEQWKSSTALKSQNPRFMWAGRRGEARRR